MKQTHLLIVEDEAIVAFDLQNTLLDLGYMIPAMAASGKDAIDKARTFRPDLILMDIILQGPMNGIEAAHIIRQELNIPVVYLTGNADMATVKVARETEPYGYILKPVDTQNLFSTIDTALYRHELEQKLTLNEERARYAIEATSDGIWDWDVISNSAYYSPNYFKMLGYEQHDFPANTHTWLSLIHPDDYARVLHIHNECIDNIRESFETEFRMKHKNGSWKWILGRGKSVSRDRSGRALRLIGTHLDITERKRAEQAIRESEEHARLKLDSILSPDIDLTDEELENFLDASELQSLMDDYYRITGIGMAILDLKGTILVATGWQDICTQFHRLHPEASKNCIESDTFLTRNVRPGDYIVYKCKNNMWDMATPLMLGDRHLGNLFLGQFFYDDETPDSSVFIDQAEKYGFDREQYMEALKKVPRWSREKVENAMRLYTHLADFISRLSLSNIKLAKALETEKKMRGELRRSEEKYRLLFDACPIGVGFSDLKGNVKAANRWMEETIGYTQEDMKTLNISSTYANPLDRERMLAQLTERGKIRDFQTELIRKGGTHYKALLNVDLVELDGEKIALTSIRTLPQPDLSGQGQDMTGNVEGNNNEAKLLQ
jgi:PAS domain S-box-containing protein